MLTDLYVIDKQTRRIHRVGDDPHDSIWIDSEGNIHYMNLQNSDGCRSGEDDEGAGYAFIKTDCGMLEGEFGIEDKKYEEEVKAYLAEAEHMECDHNFSGWTPCSVKNPTEFGRYLVTEHRDAPEELGGSEDRIAIRKFIPDRGWQTPSVSPKEVARAITDTIIAWTPLPEIYKENRLPKAKAPGQGETLK